MEKLGLEDYKLLRYYTAIAPDKYRETALDVLDKIDAFFELQKDTNPELEFQKENIKTRVTIDLTMNPDKVGDKTADIIILIPRDFPYPTTF